MNARVESFGEFDRQCVAVVMARNAILEWRQFGRRRSHELVIGDVGRLAVCAEETHGGATVRDDARVHRGEQLARFHGVDLDRDGPGLHWCEVVRGHTDRITTTRVVDHRATGKCEQIPTVRIAHDVPTGNDGCVVPTRPRFGDGGR